MCCVRGEPSTGKTERHATSRLAQLARLPVSLSRLALPPRLSRLPVRASLAASGEAPYGKTQTPANCLPAAVHRVLVRSALCGERQNKGPRLLSLCRMREIPLMGGALGALLLSGCAVSLVRFSPSLRLSLPCPRIRTRKGAVGSVQGSLLCSQCKRVECPKIATLHSSLDVAAPRSSDACALLDRGSGSAIFVPFSLSFAPL